MPLKPRLQSQLTLVRRLSEAALAVFQSPADWVFQPHPSANHALWFVGHIGTVDNFILQRLDPAAIALPEGFRELFAVGSRPHPDAAKYPPVEEMRAFYDGRRRMLLGVLEGMSEDDLLKPAPPGGPEFMTDVASIFETMSWHETLHLGQVTVARRALGHAPMRDKPR